MMDRSCPREAPRWWSGAAPAIVLGTLLGACLAADTVQAQRSDAVEWPNTDFERRSVDLGEIMSGGPPRDGIPPIDAPRFDSVEAAGEWLDPREPVVVVALGDTVHAYPLQILTWHEIVNDTVGGIPVSVTFCPLCNATIVFDRRVGERVLDFGTTGRLRMSDLVMYDRQTESWWQQFVGEAIVGEMTGTVLERLPASIVAFEDFARAHPGAKVLNRDTGHERSYGLNPYAGYDNIDQKPFLFFGRIDDRLPAMERVLNVTEGDTHKLYPFTALAGQPVLNDTVAGRPVVVMTRAGTLSVLDQRSIRASRSIPSATAWDRRLDGRVLTFEAGEDGAVDRETGSRWNLLGTAVAGPLAGSQLTALDSGVHFAFAWLAFRPDSAIYRP